MPHGKGPIARVIALGLLLVVLGVALRGRLPGVQQAEPDRPTGGPAPLIGVIALVSAAMLVVAVAIVMSIREPGRPMPAARYDVPGGGAARGRRSWRVLLIGLAALVLIYNTRTTIIDRQISIDLLVVQIKVLKSLAFLIFMAVGTTIGVLLHK